LFLYTLSSYGALELSDKGSIEAVLGVAKATHKVGKSNTLTKVGFVFHAHKASELPLFVVPCLADVNTKGNCLIGGSLVKRIVMVLKVRFDGSFDGFIKKLKVLSTN
jgi:hypothetical protein